MAEPPPSLSPAHTPTSTQQTAAASVRDDMMDVDRSLQSSHQIDVERHASNMEAAEKLQSYFIGLQLEDQPTNEETLRKRRQMLDLLVHAQACRTAGCQYPSCRRIKELFAHTKDCTKRESGGCKFCQKVWSLLRFHARACKESNCTIPRCKELKNILRILQQQAAVNEMM